MSVEVEIGQLIARWRQRGDGCLIGELEPVVEAWGEEAYRVLLQHLTGLSLPAWQARACWLAALGRMDARGATSSLLAVLLDYLHRETGLMKNPRIMETRREPSDALASIIDDLTFLYQRDFFECHLEQTLMISPADRTQGFALLMVELDRFCDYEALVGETVARDALMAVAGVLRSCCGFGDLAARLGGGRFVLMANRVDRQEAGELGQRIRCRIEKLPFPGQEKLPGSNLTASVGFSLFPRDGRTAQGLWAVAEGFLHLAAEQGNWVCPAVEEKRLFARLKHRSVIEYAIADAGEFKPAVSHDLSSSGISIGCSAETLNLGDRILLRFRRPFWGESGQVCGQVCSIRKDGDSDAFRLGVRFNAPPLQMGDFLSGELGGLAFGV